MKENVSSDSLPKVIFFITGFFLFLLPLIPDEKITRWKLWVLESGLFIILITWIFNKINSERIYIKNSELNKPILIWLIFSIFLYIISSNLHIAELELYRVIICFLSFFVFSNIILKNGRKEILIRFWLIGGFLSVIYGLMTHYGGFWIITTPKVDRIFSTFGNPIFFASFLVVSFPFIIYKITLSSNFLNRFFWFIISLAFLIALFFTKSRAGWVGLGVSSLVLIFNLLKTKKQKIFFIIVFSIITAGFIYKTKNVWTRQQAHLLIWRDSLKMVSRNPLLGVGLGTFHINFPNYASEELKKIWPQMQNIVNDAHSEFVQILAETGIIGFGIFLWIIIIYFLQLNKFKKNINDKNKILLQNVGLASVCGILVQNLFSVDMRFTISSFYLFTVIGITSSLPDNYEVNININKNQKYFFAVILIAGIIFLEYNMVVKQYRSWNLVFRSKDFLNTKILNSDDQKKIVQKMIDSNPGDAQLYFKLGYLWANEIKTNKEAIQKAIEYFSKAADINPAIENGGAYNNLGNIYFTIGNRAMAKENYIRAINVNPKLIDAHLNLGIAYYYDGKLKESVAEFEKVLQLEPKNLQAVYMLKKMRE
ncbi:MAG: hypothetical protein A2539_03705 [Elusimicrobia bacterium RIFOXYD2_FULL_34_15]|nr:MAG: hypothetical protein A2539_03705 [Elusimicrobia bacterium RIFOXYD2_FULL_34_15]